MTTAPCLRVQNKPENVAIAEVVANKLQREPEDASEAQDKHENVNIAETIANKIQRELEEIQRDL